MIEFVAHPKTTRLFRDIVITEKIDGTNACIVFEHPEDLDADEYVWVGDDVHEVAAQSRNRIITPGKSTDNYGFAGWVYDNKDELYDILGPGRHYGEWWGQGIARNYGQEGRTFSLFNTVRWHQLEKVVGNHVIASVPWLYDGVFDQAAIEEELVNLKRNGSVAAPGFMNPEGICIFDPQTRIIKKVTLDNNDKGKWES